MAKNKSVTMEEASRAILASEGDSPFRAMLELVARDALGLETAEHRGAAFYEGTEGSTGCRNGHRPRILSPP